MTKRWAARIAVLVSVTAAGWIAAMPASADRAPQSCAGALNMVNDPTMLTVAMTHDSSQGTAGMFTGVGASGC